METMRKLTDADVQSLETLIPAAIGAFIPILTARKTQIASILKKTFKYGSTDRHKLNVYFPASGTTSAPILFFAYGGGFVNGSRDLVPELVYDNLGAFFAERGIVTIIPDYRLAPQTLYPGPAHDLREAIQFALSSKEVDVVGGGGDKSRVYIMGHSAGAAIVMTLFLEDDVMPAEERAIFKGAALNGGAFGSIPMFEGYYGEPKEDVDSKVPLGLLKRKSADEVKQRLPRLLHLQGERELHFVTEWDVLWIKMLREKGFTNFEEYVIKGHNHISSALALSSGEGEDWGEEVVKWIKA